MTNDPLGLFDDNSSSDPLGLFDDEEKKKHSTFMENVGGTAAALGDIASGIVKMPAGIGAAIGGAARDVATGTPVDMEAQRQAGQAAVEDLIPSIGHAIGGENTDAYKTIMKPFNAIGEGIDWLGNKAADITGSKNIGGAVKLGTDIASLGIGVPGVEGLGHGAKVVAGAIDPAIRNAGKAKVAEMEVMRKQAEIDAAKGAEAPATPADPLGLFDDSTRQMDLLPPDNQGKTANPYEAQHGTWAVDENGIPVRTDISMEAANLENPLQRNLWGDELPPRQTPEGQAATLPMDRDIMGHEKLTAPDLNPDSIGITQAMDNTRQAGMNAEDLHTANQHLEQMQMQMDSLSHDIKASPEMERARMDSEIMTPRSPFTDASISSRGPMSRQRGAIDPQVLKEGFQKLKQLADGTWLRAFGDGSRLHVEATKDGHVVGKTEFNPQYDMSRAKGDPRYNERDLVSDWTGVRQDARGKGLSSEMYRFASELGNDIRPSDTRTEQGKAMWDKFAQNGLAKDGQIPAKKPYVPLKQRGAVGNLNPGKTARTILDDIKARYEKEANNKPMIPDNPDPKQVVSDALEEGKDSKQWKYTESGATLAAMKRGSAAVQGAARIIQNAAKAADYNIRKMVFPVEKAFRKLSKPEVEGLSNLMKQEMLSGKRYDATALEGLSLKQQVAYAHMRAMFHDTLRIQNEAREAKGQAPITEMEAYLSSRWKGDFRRPVFQAILDKAGNPVINKEGSIQRKLVYYLAADTKMGLEKQWKALQKEHPDFAYDPKEDHVVRMFKRETDLQSAYSTILDILGDDPHQREAVNLITRALQEQTVNEAASFLGQEKHFKEKAGIRGFVGDRPGKTGPSEALDMFQQQIQYAKNAYKWSEMQKAGLAIKDIVSDKDLVRQQPNNVQYIKEYYKNNIGYGEAVAIAHLEDSIRNLGMSPAVVRNAVGSMKSYFILQKLAVNTGYTVANLIQTSNILPHLMDLNSQGIRGNFLKAVPMGILGGIAMAGTHYVNMFRGKQASFLGTPEGAFLNRAFKYAEDNGVTARALYDEAPIHASFSKVGMAANALGKTMSTSEAFIRSMAYMTFVQFMKDSGKFRNDMEIFQKADELTNAALVDYRAGEKPMVFNKLGTMGDFLNTLQTYPMNWYNQWNYFGRQAAKGNVTPFLSALMLQYAVAGAMGIPGFEDMTKLWDVVKNNLIPTSTYAKYRDNDFFVDPKMWMVKNFGDSSVYGWLSDKSGIGLTSRVNAPGAGQMLTSPAGPITDIYKQGKNWVDAVANHNSTSLAQAAMSSVPPGLQGLLEQAPFMEGKTFDVRQGPDGKPQRVYQRPGNIASHTGVVTRTPQEETLRNFGLRSQRETVERELGYRVHDQQMVDADKIKKIPEGIYDAAKRGDKESVRDLYEAYIKLTGKEPSPELFDAQVKQNFMTSFERAATAAKSVTQLKDVARMKSILEEVRNEHQSGRNQ